MKLFLFLLLANIAAGQSVNLAKLGPTNFSLTVTGAVPGRVYWVEQSSNLVQWQRKFAFPGSTNSYGTNLVLTNKTVFVRTTNQRQIVTNLLPFSFIPYPPIAGTWQAFPTLDVADLITPVITINGVKWFVFVKSQTFLEIRTENTYTNPPVFSVGDEVLVDWGFYSL